MSTQRLEILCKWRQAYTLQATSGAIGVERFLRDTAEAKLLQRVELSAIVALLIQKGVFSQVEFSAQVEVEAEELDKKMQKVFPGVYRLLARSGSQATGGSRHDAKLAKTLRHGRLR